MAYKSLIKELLAHLPAVLIFLVVSVVYFYPQLEGKRIQAGDMVSYKGNVQEVKAFEKETGEISHWTNALFGGMPTYQIHAGQPDNQLKHIYRAIKLYIPRPIGLFFAISMMFYLLLVYLKLNRWLCILGALAFTYTAGNLILWEAGHVTKLKCFASFPIILMGMLMAFNKKYWQGAVIFALGLGLNLYANHVQMTYYFFLALGVYGLTELVLHWKAGNLASYGKAVAALTVATLIAVGSSSSNILVTMEYAKDTMRGDPILVTNASSSSSSSETKGLAWDYAMQWSNGWMDLVAGLIPGVAGGSSSERMSEDSALYKDFKAKGANLGNNFKGPMYWGKLPGTSGPYYYGAIFCFLFIIGLLLIKGPVKWALAIIVLLFMLLSMGKNMELINHFLFDYFPLLNKFRAPNSALWIGGIFVPILSMLALNNIVSPKLGKEEILRATKIAFAIVGGVCLFFGLMGPSVFDFSNSGDARIGQMGYNLQALIEDRKALMRSDSFRSLFLIIIAAGGIWAFVNKKIKSTVLIAVLAVFAFGDIWIVDKRYVDHADFINTSTYQNNFKPRAVDTQILKDKDLNYRVFDMSIDVFQSSSSSYLHKTIGGYHPAKLQRYQDIIDYYLSKGDQGVLGMLNTKYVIDRDEKLQRFDGYGNAWMINKLRIVNSANEEIEAVKGLDARNEAIVHKEFENYVAGVNPVGTGTISLSAYQPNKLTYQSNSSSEELAVFSEVWYGPNKGWNAYIDGELVDHIRVNYILRALKIPAGQHKIEFKFEPQAYKLGNTITIVLSLAILLSFFWYLYTLIKDYKPEEKIEPKVKEKKNIQKTKPKKKRK